MGAIVWGNLFITTWKVFLSARADANEYSSYSPSSPAHEQENAPVRSTRKRTIRISLPTTPEYDLRDAKTPFQIAKAYGPLKPKMFSFLKKAFKKTVEFVKDNPPFKSPVFVQRRDLTTQHSDYREYYSLVARFRQEVDHMVNSRPSFLSR